MKYVRFVLLCFIFMLICFCLNVNAEEIKAIECPSEYDVNKDLYSLITNIIKVIKVIFLLKMEKQLL